MHEIADYTEQETMLLADVNLLALNLMLQHGLIEQNWSFSFDRAKNRLGCCKHSKKMITMSSIITPGQSKSAIVNTILHEIAHALVGPGVKHGPEWKAKAQSIGCTGDRCSKIETPIEYRWYAVCETCDHRVGMHRAPNRVRSCVQCRQLVTWKQNGVTVHPHEMPIRFQTEYYMIQGRLQEAEAAKEQLLGS